jgi:hypothetical protein
LQYSSPTEITKKIEILEERTVTKTYENVPIFVRNYFVNLAKNSECHEYQNWIPGIYYLLNSGGESIIFYDSTGTEHYFQNIAILKSELESKKLNPLAFQIFCAFSETISENQLNNAFLKIRLIGFKRIKLIYIKDNRFVEKYAFDSLQIIRIKQTKDSLVSQGVEPSNATIKATMPLLISCPAFIKVRMTTSGRSYDEIKAKIINAVKTNSKLRFCNIRNVIDYCFLTFCPWNTYGIIEIDINDFEKITKKTFKK